MPLSGSLDRPGAWLALPALVELHDESADLVPNSRWRGRIALEGGWVLGPSPGLPGWVTIGVALEHESDHVTAPRLRPSGCPDGLPGPCAYGFVFLDALATRVELTVPWRSHAFTAVLLGRAHLFSCTVADLYCGEAWATRGSMAAELAVELVRRGGGWAAPAGVVRPFAALYASALPGRATVASERRAVLDAGVFVRAARGGPWRIHGGLYLGSDVGIARRLDSNGWGVGIRRVP